MDKEQQIGYYRALLGSAMLSMKNAHPYLHDPWTSKDIGHQILAIETALKQPTKGSS